MEGGIAVKTEFEVARERRDRVTRMTGVSPTARAHYQFYKERLNRQRMASMARLRAN